MLQFLGSLWSLYLIYTPEIVQFSSDMDHRLFSPGKTNQKSQIIEEVIFFVLILSKWQEQLSPFYSSICH